MSGRAPIIIPRALLHEVFRHARDVFPAECCGWLAGPRGGHDVATIRPCRNAQETAQNVSAAADARTAETAYVIAGDDLRELSRAHDRSETPPRILYHSHPNGRAYFSDTDQLAAAPLGEPSYEVQHLVVGIDAGRVTEAALFDWSESEERYVEIARFEGAEL